MATTTVHARAYFRDASTTLRATHAADGTLIISRRAYRAAEGRCCYAGIDSLYLAPIEGYRHWGEAQGCWHGGEADGSVLERGTWYAKPIAKLQAA
jgi:hypothetical protein